MNSCCVPIFQSLALTVAKIGRGSQLIWMLPWRRPPIILVQDVVLGKLVPNASYVPNLKLLASMVAEKSRRSQFLGDAPVAKTLPILVLNAVFW